MTIVDEIKGMRWTDILYKDSAGGICTLSVWDDGELGIRLADVSHDLIPASVVMRAIELLAEYGYKA